MISKIESIPINDKSYPFASAERYLKISEKGYKESEYYMYGTANVYESIGERGEVGIKTANAPYVNRFIMRAPENPDKFSGNVVVEIINPTSYMEIDRMWILGQEKFLRDGDIYVGITSKPNTIPKLLEFDSDRYSKLSWANPTPENPFDFDAKKENQMPNSTGDLDIAYETGLIWDMLTDLAWVIREKKEISPLKEYDVKAIYLTGWSQSACYLFRYVNSFAFKKEVAKDGQVYDGYLAGGGVRGLITPVNQYESLKKYDYSLMRVAKMPVPFIDVQTESENGRYESFRTMRPDSDSPDYMYRLYEVTGASHDTTYSYVDYYCEDPDLIRINHLPRYQGLNEEGNDYPSQILFAAAYRNLFNWTRFGFAPNHCERIPVDSEGENKKDAFGNTIGGLRTCLLNYPTGRYSNTSRVKKGGNAMDPEAETEGLYGYQEAFPADMLKYLYGSLSNYEKLCEADTKEQVSKGFVCREDANKLVKIAVELAAKRGLN